MKRKIQVLTGNNATKALRIDGDALLFLVFNSRGEVKDESELVERIGLLLQLSDGMTDEDSRKVFDRGIHEEE